MSGCTTHTYDIEKKKMNNHKCPYRYTRTYENRLDLRAGHVESFILDQLFNPIYNKKPAMLVVISDISGMQPILKKIMQKTLLKILFNYSNYNKQ